jgi:hypothetical protein
MPHAARQLGAEPADVEPGALVAGLDALAREPHADDQVDVGAERVLGWPQPCEIATDSARLEERPTSSAK